MPIYFLEKKKPIIVNEESTYIAPSAEIIGDIVLGAETSIWFGAVLRGDRECITIGEGSNIQDLVVIHTDMGAPAIIGRNCTIGHKALLHGCTISDNCLIGMGAIIMNHAIIGKNSIVGAGSLVTERKNFPPDSLITGSPAVVKRSLTSNEIEAIQESASGYKENAIFLKKNLERVH